MFTYVYICCDFLEVTGHVWLAGQLIRLIAETTCFRMGRLNEHVVMRPSSNVPV